MADTDEKQTPTSQEEVKLESAPVGKKGTQTPPSSEDVPSKAEARFTQEDLNRIVKKELATAAKKAAELADEETARAKGEFEKLATTYKAELAELKPKYEAVSSALNALLDAEMASLPAKVRALKPSTDDPVLLTEWLPNAKKLAEDLVGSDKAAVGNTKGPKPSKVSTDDLIENNKKILRQSGKYTGF